MEATVAAAGDLDDAFDNAGPRASDATSLVEDTAESLRWPTDFQPFDRGHCTCI